MKINKETIENEINMWRKFYCNYENLAINILADVLASYKKEDREKIISQVNETLESVKEPINGATMYESIKGDIESFDRVNEEAKVAVRTLTWIQGLEETEKETE